MEVPVSTPDSRGELLIVDDTPANLRLLSQILNREGYRVRTAINGLIALSSVQTAPPDLILLDIRMPELDGYQVCTRLKAEESTRDIPVIFISALDDTEDIVRAFDSGGVDYIVKPFQVQEVLARVHSHVTLAQQRRQLEMQREKDRQYYETLNAIKSQFVNAATHDLKNPLQLSMGYAHLLLDIAQQSGQTDLIEAYIQPMIRSQEKMQRLVASMLDLAQITTGVNFTPEPASVSRMVADCVHEHELLAQDKNLTLTCDLPDEELTVRVDLQYISRAIGNLLSNAIKYTPTGGSVTVTVCREDAMARINVTDNGPGIPEEAQAELFEAFYRVRQRAVRDIEGTGLGLSIVKAIIDQHGGRVAVSSAPGKGSTFSLFLPLETVPV